MRWCALCIGMLSHAKLLNLFSDRRNTEHFAIGAYSRAWYSSKFRDSGWSQNILRHIQITCWSVVFICCETFMVVQPLLCPVWKIVIDVFTGSLHGPAKGVYSTTQTWPWDHYRASPFEIHGSINILLDDILHPFTFLTGLNFLDSVSSHWSQCPGAVHTLDTLDKFIHSPPSTTFATNIHLICHVFPIF